MDWDASIRNVYYLLPYGLAFIALGLVLLLASRSPLPVLPRHVLGFIAAFGLLHGVRGFLEIAQQVEARIAIDDREAYLQVLAPVMNALSFAALMQAGVETLVWARRAPRWTRWLPGSVLLAWTVAVVVLPPHPRWPEVAGWSTFVDALCRFALGFPGALIAAGSLLAVARASTQGESRKIRRYFIGAAAALAGYAVFTGLVVAPTPLLSAWPLTTEAFARVTHVPVELLRGGLAVVFAGFLSEACVVQAAWLVKSVERQREEFISVVAHDLRAPLTTISLTAASLERLPADQHSGDREKHLLSSINVSTRRLSRMIGDLLDASRLEANRLELRREPANLTELIRGVVERAAAMTKGHPVRLVSPERLVVEVDPQRLEQVLDNLLSNAAKHSFPGREITVEVEPRQREVTVSVINQGEGLSPEDFPRLFSRFYRGKAAREGTVEGLGLGLYITKGLVEAHGGTIWAESTPGESATFRFTLPRDRRGALSRPPS
ncbi:MAG: sensor histidine kinase [Myxococcaceae bacterium]